MQDNLIDQGLNLMLFGMGTVFVFLTILVFATTVMSKLVGRFAPAVEPQAAQAETPQLNTAQNDQPSPQIMAAIKQAISAHRQR